jgi:hypothetical protein
MSRASLLPVVSGISSGQCRGTKSDLLAWLGRKQGALHSVLRLDH